MGIFYPEENNKPSREPDLSPNPQTLSCAKVILVDAVISVTTNIGTI